MLQCEQKRRDIGRACGQHQRSGLSTRAQTVRSKLSFRGTEYTASPKGEKEKPELKGEKEGVGPCESPV